MTASARYATQQASDSFDCVQSDTAELTAIAVAIRFDAAGTVKATGEGGNSQAYNVLAGEWWYGVRVKQIWDTGTSLTNAQIACWKH